MKDWVNSDRDRGDANEAAAVADDDDDNGAMTTSKTKTTIDISEGQGGGGDDNDDGKKNVNAMDSVLASRLGECGEEGHNDDNFEVVKDDEDAAAMERMMAFQEEQEEGVGAITMERNIIDDNNFLDIGNGAEDPNVVFLGDNHNHDEDDVHVHDDDNDDEVEQDMPLLHHPNHHHPAALALRQRQAILRNARHGVITDTDGGLLHKLASSSLVRSVLQYVPLSMITAVALLHHTLRTRQQFYLAMTYLQTSKLSYVILGNAIIAFSVGLFGTITSIFLDGGLRPNERDMIVENIRWDVTETCLALTIFRNELDVLTTLQFLFLVVMKCLHWSVELRGGHLRMTEEVFVYPDDEDDDNNVDVDIVNRDARHRSFDSFGGRSWWWHRLDLLPRLRLTHVCYYSLVVVLLAIDVLAVAHCALSVATHGPSVDILFGFEAAILLVSGLSSMGMYHLHVIDGVMGVFQHLAEGGERPRLPLGGMANVDDTQGTTPGLGAEGREDVREGGQRSPQDPLRQDGGEEETDGAREVSTRTRTLARKLVERLANPWRDRRAMLSFAIELQAQAAKFLFYVVFFAIVFTYYRMPINIFREVYVSYQQLRRRLIAFNNYRRLTHNMEKRFDSIKDEEELDRIGHTCIICRDSMDCLGGCVKLPGCGHAFHKHCLRDWLVQQQTCPTCRSDIAANEARAKKEKEREAAVAAAAEVAAPADLAPAPGDDASAVVATDGAFPQRPGNEQLFQRTIPTLPPPNDSVGLPPGWNQHVDASSGRVYYFNRGLGLTTWEKPVGETAAPPDALVAQQVNDASSDVILHANNDFPCLYRITRSPGARVYDSRAVQQRLVPHGKLIVCTSFELWPLEPMLRMPDGYVRPRDVEQFLSLRMAKVEKIATAGAVQDL